MQIKALRTEAAFLRKTLDSLREERRQARDGEMRSAAYAPAFAARGIYICLRRNQIHKYIPRAANAVCGAGNAYRLRAPPSQRDSRPVCAARARRQARDSEATLAREAPENFGGLWAPCAACV